MRFRDALIPLVLVALAGCRNAELTGDESLRVAEANVHFAHVVLDGSDYGKARDSIDFLVALYREKPDAEHDGTPLRDVLQDAASNLDAYQPDMAAALDRATR